MQPLLTMASTLGYVKTLLLPDANKDSYDIDTKLLFSSYGYYVIAVVHPTV
jgi:hypothetical protein